MISDSAETMIPDGDEGPALADEQVGEQHRRVPVAAEGRALGVQSEGEVAEVVALAAGQHVGHGE